MILEIPCDNCMGNSMGHTAILGNFHCIEYSMRVSMGKFHGIKQGHYKTLVNFFDLIAGLNLKLVL